MKVFSVVQSFLYPEGVSKIPPLMMLLVFTNTFFYSMISTMPFSFLPKMVRSFGISEVEVGRYAGLLASSVFVGRIISSMPWGYLTDNKGKKFSTLLTGKHFLCCDKINPPKNRDDHLIPRAMICHYPMLL